MTAPALVRPWAADQVPLHEGAVFLLDGEERTVVSPCFSQTEQGDRFLHVADGHGTVEQVPIRELALVRDVRPVPEAKAPARRADARTELSRLDKVEQQILQLKLAHVLEAETGYRSGDPDIALPGEPKPEYDPDLVKSVEQRRKNKVAEIEAAKRTLDPDAVRRAGIDGLSFRSLQRMAAAWHRTRSVAAVVDRRRLRPTTGPRLAAKSVGDSAARQERRELVRNLIFDVEDHYPVTASKVTLATRHEHLLRLGRQAGLTPEDLPSRETYRLLRKDWFGRGRGRAKYQRSDAVLPDQMVSVKPTRPGEIVMLDTSDWDAYVLDGLYDEPTTAKLTLAVDVYTRSIVGFRFTLVSDKSVDVAMVLRDVMMPMPMREGWDPDVEWPYPGVPAAVVAQGAGYTVAGKPWFEIETATTDHGAVYTNHHVIALAEQTGINLLPARKARGRDKAVVERMFGTIRQLLIEKLPAFRGIDVHDRGADPEADACMLLEDAEEYLAWFVTHVWQQRPLGEYRPWWSQSTKASPNALFGIAMAQGGWTFTAPDPNLYYALLENARVKVYPRGVRVAGYWYRDPSDPTGLGAIGDPRTHDGTPASQSRYISVKRDPRDCRYVYFQDDAGKWHELRWTGLPADPKAVPAFSDITAKAMLKAARDRGIRPKDQTELLALLDEYWAKSHLSKKSRTQRAREHAQGKAAAADRAAAAQPVNTASPALSVVGTPSPVRAVGDPWKDNRSVANAADAADAARREADAAAAPAPAPQVTRRRRDNPFLIEGDDA